MSKRRRRSIFDEIFGKSLFDDLDRIFEKLESEVPEGGYSISVTQTPEGTKVYAKVGKNVNVYELKRRLQSQYPGAKIVIEGGEPLIREVSTKQVDTESSEDKNKSVKIKVE